MRSQSSAIVGELGNVISGRAGVLLELTDANGMTGIGEASPFPALGDGTVADGQRPVHPRRERQVNGTRVRRFAAESRKPALAAPH